jgi:hypothetical protein
MLHLRSPVGCSPSCSNQSHSRRSVFCQATASQQQVSRRDFALLGTSGLLLAGGFGFADKAQGELVISQQTLSEIPEARAAASCGCCVPQWGGRCATGCVCVWCRAIQHLSSCTQSHACGYQSRVTYLVLSAPFTASKLDVSKFTPTSSAHPLVPLSRPCVDAPSCRGVC